MNIPRPAPLPDRPIADLPWQGEIKPKPWEYPVTVVIPTINTLEQVKLALPLWRMQSVRPYIMLIDTGSECQEVYDSFKLRANDLEVHMVRANAYAHPSEPVTAAMDLAFSLCQTPYILATHADVFPRSNDLIAHWLERAYVGYDIVGYRMSPRNKGFWYSCPSHTCSLYYCPVMDRLGARWCLRAYENTVEPGWSRLASPGGGWPDTESAFGYMVMTKKARWWCIGDETNGQRHVDLWIDHVRSFPSSKIYSPGYHEQAKAWMVQAMTEAADRAKAWRDAGYGKQEEAT